MVTKKIMSTVAGVMFVLATTLACINASPSECIQAAEETGLSDEVIEQLKNPGDLNPAERFALNRALNKAGIADACGEIAGEQDTERTNTELLKLDEETSDTEQTEDPERPTPTVELSARIPEDDEHRRRCRFWALNNLQPIVFEEFAKLDPDNMDDLDRILWRSKLHPYDHLGFYDDDDARGDDIPSLQPKDPGIYCRDYWAEPLGPGNAALRNHGFETQCRSQLDKRITGRYSQLADAVNRDEDNDLAYQTPNQYVRILQWLDMSGDELLESDSPPYIILQEQSPHPYAHIGDWVPDEDFMADYRRELDSRADLEWLGIVSAAGMSDNSSPPVECLLYYPQVFYGYWVPFDPDAMPDYGEEGEWDLPKYEPSTMPIFLPETVDARRVRAGYPLGKTGERYHRCSGQSEAEEAGYYFVDHPTGAYCERIR